MPRVSYVKVIIWMNVMVFILWHTSDGGNFEDSFMFQNFLVSWEALVDGRFWVLLTSVFSHISLIHILLNMFVLNNFGPILERVLGAKAFLKFYLAAGILSSLSHALVSAFILGKPEVPALGASGAISGLVMVFSLLFPKQIMLLFGIIPVPALIGALIFSGLDLWGLFAQAEGGGLPIGHGAHLGGAFCGLVYFFFVLRPRLHQGSYYW